MQSKGSFTSRIAGFCFRHKWYVLAAWMVVLVASGLLSANLDHALTTDTKDLSGSDSAKALQLITDSFGKRPPSEMVVIRSETDTVDSPVFKQTTADLIKQLSNTRGVAQQNGVPQILSYLQVPDPSLVSKDRHAALVAVVLSGDTDAVNKNIPGIMAVVKNAQRPAGYAIHESGIASSSYELGKISNDDRAMAETIGLPIALIVIILAFGTVAAAVVPILMGLSAIVPALGIVALVAIGFQINYLVTAIISMIGLAVGIDYSLFIIGRYREELGRGRTPEQAIGIAADSSGRAVIFSGITVMLALASMLFVRVNVFVSIGVGAIIVVLVAVVASLTLLPTILGIFGRHINALPVPFLGKAQFGNRFWSLVIKAVQKQPILCAAGSIAVLLAISYPLTQISLGVSGVNTLPHNTQAYQGFIALQRDFNVGLSDPLNVVVQGKVNSPQVKQAIDRFKAAVDKQSDLQWLDVKFAKAGDVAEIDVAANTIDTDTVGRRIVHDLRGDAIPQAFNGSGAAVYLGGSLPSYFDVRDNMESKLPFVFAFVLALSFVLLMMVFRSLFIPAKAIVMNLLSVGAAYGLLVLVFQKGVLAGPLGYIKTPQVEFWLPLFLFSILFGLSMDYEVFLLSRIKEEWDRTGDNKLAVRNGVVHTAGMITSAAIIMVAVFVAFSRSHLVSMQQMGFGLAMAVFVDATLIRTVLVPSTMELAGRLNWWMPSWLNWLPQISVEGSSAMAADHEPAPSLAGGGD